MSATEHIFADRYRTDDIFVEFRDYPTITEWRPIQAYDSPDEALNALRFYRRAYGLPEEINLATSPEIVLVNAPH